MIEENATNEELLKLYNDFELLESHKLVDMVNYIIDLGWNSYDAITVSPKAGVVSRRPATREFLFADKNKQGGTINSHLIEETDNQIVFVRERRLNEDYYDIQILIKRS